jgi:2-polyprenyl-3-methyl-5-hydroxy-6-metoxy-1,4-benzoquinol methylase
MPVLPMKDALLRSDCPVCASRRLRYAFSHASHRISRCADCAVLFSNPQPTDEELAAIYNADYFLGGDNAEGRASTREMKRATARQYLAEIQRYGGTKSGRLLEVGCGDGDFLIEAEEAGYLVTGVEFAPSACEQARARIKSGEVICGLLENSGLPEEEFDLCVLSDVIEHVRDPLAFLRGLHRLLKPGGAIFIATPSLHSWSAKLLRQNWMEFKPEHLTYFDPKTIQTALFHTGYQEVIVQPGWKILSFDYIAQHFARFPVPLVSPLVRFLADLLPQGARRKYRRIVASGMMVFARKTVLPAKRKLSIVLPAYNEAATFEPLMEAVLRKEVPGLDVEVVLVESNSTDGTRELAQKYADHPRVRLMLEDRPRGKGHAVRTGLMHARGDFILIQDADLEYDLEDYDALLEPLVSGREAFTLGARHGGGAWKMRQFTDQPLLSLVFNFAHWGFTTLINVCFLQRLKDPFTMYKVFRRDCLFGLNFECNRFDFDWELLIKLLGKGYKPLEMPVNYRSRSFKEGKKVSLFGDPISWLKICLKLRFTRIDPMQAVEGQRLAATAPQAVSLPAAAPVRA